MGSGGTDDSRQTPQERKTKGRRESAEGESEMTDAFEKALDAAVDAYEQAFYVSPVWSQEHRRVYMKAAILAALPHLGEPYGYLFEEWYDGQPGRGPEFSYTPPIENYAIEVRNRRILYLAPPAPAVAIKPLEWVDDGEKSRAESSIGDYVVGKVHNVSGWFCLGGTGWNSTGSFEKAKAAAQADYEARIRLALVDAPAPAIPAGWKLVPADATNPMVKAALDIDWTNEDEAGTVHNVWHAMLAAAPKQMADPDLGRIKPGHVCKHGIRWPHACDECDTAAFDAYKASQSWGAS